jgi:hypothetical protein
MIMYETLSGVFSLLAMVLTYRQNVSSLTAQARQFPLKKPAGFHWDFFLLGCTTFISGIIGIPFPNGLVPQVRKPASVFNRVPNC